MSILKKPIPILAGLVISLSSCEFQSYEDFGFPEYDGEFQWTQVVKNAEWPNRYGHAAVVYDNKKALNKILTECLKKQKEKYELITWLRLKV